MVQPRLFAVAPRVTFSATLSALFSIPQIAGLSNIHQGGPDGRPYLFMNCCY